MRIIEERTRPVFKDFKLTGHANASIDLSAGEEVITINDVSPENSVMGIEINHVYSGESGTNGAGGGFRLSLEESLTKNESGEYVYIDQNGRKYLFKEYFYYVDEDNKKHYVEKHTLSIGVDGVLQYAAKRAYVEYKSATGLTLSAELEKINSVQVWLDQRASDLRTIQSKRESCILSIKDHVYFERHDSKKAMHKDLLDDYNKVTKIVEIIEKGNEGNYIVMLSTEAEQYAGLLAETEPTDNQKVMIQGFEDEERTRRRVSELKALYREYVLIYQEAQRIERETACRYITDGKNYKGFNEFGELVSIFDSYQNSVIIERECDYTNKKKWLIKNVYDSFGNVVTFSHQPNGFIKSITDINGQVIEYSYNGERLKEIIRKNGEKQVLTYNGMKIAEILDTLSSQKSCLSYNENKINKIATYSLELDENGNNLIINETTVDYLLNEDSTTSNVTISNETQRNRYYFANDNLCEYRKEENGVVVDAERYEHVPYWIGATAQENPRDVVVKADKQTFYTKSLDEFNFVDEDKVTTIINMFEKPEKTTYSAKRINPNGETTKKTTIEYVYDSKQKLVDEITKVKYSNLSSSVISHKKYSYNIFGEVVKTESYIEGRESTEGKTIEEFVYDDKGNCVKTFTYNTLDATAKFYNETTFDEKGKAVAQKTPSGDSETKQTYIGNSLTETILPSGSRFAYGYDECGNLVSIAQSTKDGETNSTERFYQNGLLTMLKSGNVEINYEYDYKKRIKRIGVNGTTDYLTYTYNDDVEYNGVLADSVLATYAYRDGGVGNETIETIKDKQGNILCVKINGVVQQEKTYEKGLLSTVEDKILNKKYKYERNSLDQTSKIILVDENGDEISEVESLEYDQKGRLVKNIIGSHTFSKGYTSFTKDLLDRTYHNQEKTKYYYDLHNRIIKKEMGIPTKRHEIQYSYLKKGDHATDLVSTVRYGYKMPNNKYFLYDNINYTYDKMDNITHARNNGELEIRYTYDDLGRLIREDNRLLNKTILYAYDNTGNILSKKTYEFTLCNTMEVEVNEPLSEVHNKYYKDQLKETGPYTCTYDEIGNPTIYKNKSMTWESGRRLKKYKDIELAYDGFGRRIKKGNLEFTYDLSGRLLGQSNGIEFIHNESEIIGFTKTTVTQGETLEDGTIEEIKTADKYYYQKDLMGNVIALLDEKGMRVVQYAYDAWGNHKVLDLDGEEITDTTNIGHVNPIRYRSYYYDADFGFYYLNTRYYDPKIGRFINMDDTAFLAPDVINGLNLYAYCGNNPVMNVDPNGTLFFTLLIGAVIGAVVGAVSSVAEAVVENKAIDWGDVAISAVVGVVSGALAVTGVGGVVGQMAIQGALSAIETVAISASNNETINVGEVALNAVVDGVTSGIGSIGVAKEFKRVLQIENSLTKVVKREFAKKGLSGAKNAWAKKSGKYVREFVQPQFKGIFRQILISLGIEKGKDLLL